MRLILEEEFNKRIKEKFLYDFDVSEKGLYVIEITGRAKSWFQNTLRLISFFKDDDLTVKIDGREFPKLSVPLPTLNLPLASRDRPQMGQGDDQRSATGNIGTGTRLFDSEAAWNGNKLKDLSQINAFCMYLEAGKHTLQFIADQSPLLETAKIYQALNEKNILFEPIKNYQIERGNRRPWFNFVLVDLALEELKIQASAGQKSGDDDDIQLKINGERQINDTLKSHKYWYWCGRVLKGQSRAFDKRINLPAGLHYIELWADNAPIVEEVVFRIEEAKPTEGEVGRIALYADVTSEQKVINLRAQSNDNSEILKEIPNGARIVIIEKAVKGNRPDGLLSDLWHEILYQGATGFVHSSLIEIRGQERGKIVEAIKMKARELNIDEKLALNLAHCESKWLPFARSEVMRSNTETDYYSGIYQLGEDTVKDINEKHGGNISDVYDAYQNIDGGLRYLKHLLEIYEGAQDYLSKVIAAWNAGSGEVPYTGALNLENYESQVGEIVDCILKERRGENVLKYLKILFLPLVISVGLWAFFTSDDYKNLNAREKYLAMVAQQEIDYLTRGENFALVSPSKAREKEVEIDYLQTDLDGDGKFEKIIFTFYSPESFIYYTHFYAPDGEKIILDGSLGEAFVDDLTDDGIKELIVKTITGKLSATYIFSYDNGRLTRVPIYYEDGLAHRSAMYDSDNDIEFQTSWLTTLNTIVFEDLDSDGVKEIILALRGFTEPFIFPTHYIEPTYYYRWNGRGFILYDQKDIELKISPRG